MARHSVRAERHPTCDLAIGRSLGRERDHLELTVAQTDGMGGPAYERSGALADLVAALCGAAKQVLRMRRADGGKGVQSMELVIPSHAWLFEVTPRDLRCDIGAAGDRCQLDHRTTSDAQRHEPERGLAGGPRRDEHEPAPSRDGQELSEAPRVLPFRLERRQPRERADLRPDVAHPSREALRLDELIGYLFGDRLEQLRKDTEAWRRTLRLRDHRWQLAPAPLAVEDE